VGSEADDPGVGSDERVRQRLERELGRLKAADPLGALELPASAAVQDVRARYLELVKRYHPTRYARRPREVVRLANEVFLKLKAAYEAITEPTASDPPLGRRVSQKGERLERVSPPSQPKLAVDAALARRRRLRSYPVLPSVDTVRPEEMADRVRRREEDRRQRLLAAIGELRAGRLNEAREILRALLAETPTDSEVRTYLNYTLGREHHAAGRNQAARSEYQRALAIDPGFEPALKSLAILDGGEDKEEGEERGGLISRWFRR